MKQLNVQTGKPTAHITVNKNRLKNYNEKVYLKSGTNFEIELFNPLTKRVLVKIEIDGMTISSTGLILNPGQRAYLERWIDDNRKFLFQTYDVENSEEINRAIANNGKVKISFYEEQSKSLISYDPYPNIWWHSSPYYGGTTSPYIYGSTGQVVTFGGTTNQANYYVSNTGLQSINVNNNVDFSSFEDKIETGRTEMGEKSNQEFGTTFGDFNLWTTEVIEWQIIPDSRKPVEISKIRQYCPNCKNRIRKDSWKFCPACGEEL